MVASKCRDVVTRSIVSIVEKHRLEGEVVSGRYLSYFGRGYLTVLIGNKLILYVNYQRLPSSVDMFHHSRCLEKMG